MCIYKKVQIASVLHALGTTVGGRTEFDKLHTDISAAALEAQRRAHIYKYIFFIQKQQNKVFFRSNFLHNQ